MNKTVAHLRTRLGQLERYQLLLKLDRAELEALLLNKRLVEEQLKFKTMNCGYSCGSSTPDVARRTIVELLGR